MAPEEDGTGDPKVYDVVIIGGGPGGLSAAMYAARAGLSIVVLDKNPTAGALGSTEKIENYPGFPEPLSGPGLLDRFRVQAERFGAEVLQRQVLMVDMEAEPKEVFTSEGKYHGRTVIVATGSMGRKPSIDGEADHIGKGVSYCATCDAAFFKDKEVAITGSIDVVLEEIDVIARFANKVHLVTTDKDLTDKERVDLGRMPNVEPILGSRITDIVGEPTVTGIKVRGGGGERTIDVAGVFVFLHGSQPITDFLHDALDRTEDGAIRVDKEDMSTSIPGVFAIGDVATKRYRQVVIAASDGCIAALSCDRYINKREKPRYQWAKK